MRSLKLRVGTSGKVSEPHDDDIGTYHAGGPCIAPAVAGSGFIEELASRTANRHRFTARSQHAAKDKLRFTREHIGLGRGGLSFEEPKRPEESFPRDHGVELGGVGHGDFCAPQNKGKPVPIFVMGELDTGAFEEFIEPGAEALFQIDRRNIAREHQCIFGGERPSEAAVCIVRGPSADGDRAVNQDRLFVNKPLIERQRIGEGLQHGTGASLGRPGIDLALN